MGLNVQLLVLLTLLSRINSQPSFEDVQQTMGILGRQLMLQQLFVEERIRSETNSGLKQVRLRTSGTRPYYAETFGAAGRIAAVHDHANYINTVGLGELIGVMNGVEFRTRHNDYKLVMPSRTSGEYEATEDVPFPDVPPEVTAKATLNEQVLELREWFKAWSDQDYSVRDYRKHFKPVLCYLEGAWTTAVDTIEESFDSDRHSLDATSWLDLQDKVRFTSYSGSKSLLENFAYLPTTIIQMINGTYPNLAQWNYRILCHPLNRDVPLNRFRIVDDLATRMRKRTTYDSMAKSRAARFQINVKDQDEWEDGIQNYGLLDELMYEIPGKDNYQGNLKDDAEDNPVYTYNSVDSTELNAAYYHRWLRVGVKDAMGVQTRHRGFADENLFMAMTTQPQVAGVEAELGQGKKKRLVSQKWTYAIPLEIIYLTPLSSWNPYNIEYKGHEKTDLAKTVFANSRNGGKTTEKAFDGASSKYYYLTPSAFYSNSIETDSDPADTTRSGVGVLDRNREMHMMSATGIRAVFPNIPGLGVLRQRYPIFPVDGEGESVWKELEALKDIVLFPQSSGYLFREKPAAGAPADAEPAKIIFKTGASTAETGSHVHSLTLLAEDLEALREGTEITKTTSEDSGHAHTLVLAYFPADGKWPSLIRYVQCDDRIRGKVCMDRHRPRLFPFNM